MKKIAFTFQVFALMAILPLCVIVEMNHAMVLSTENTAARKSAGEEENISTTYSREQGVKVKI